MKRIFKSRYKAIFFCSRIVSQHLPYSSRAVISYQYSDGASQRLCKEAVLKFGKEKEPPKV